MNIRLVDVRGPDWSLINRWLKAEHVRRWWGDPGEILVQLGRLPAESRLAVIEADGRKVGLVLWGHPPATELDEAGLHDVSPDAIDIDIMIGEQDMVGRGVGTAAIRLVVEEALADPTVPYLIAVPMMDNIASIGAFSKAGFSVDRRFDDPVCGRCVLLVRRRDS
ncbi:MAG: GNAT family N-acetyltransferase [Candidatus Zixiibacteriota bacterium]